MSRWYKRDGAAFIQGTMGLSLEEKGAYSLCLDLIYSNGGPIADDARWLSGVCGVSLRKWAAIRGSLVARGKLFAQGGTLMNQRAVSVIADQSTDHTEAVENGAKGGRKRAENAAKSHETSANHQRNDVENGTTSNEIKTLAQANKTREEQNREEQKEEDSSGAASRTPPETLIPFIEIPTNRFETGGEQFPVYEPMIEEYQRLYPAVDVRSELRKMRGWAIGKPQKRKTKRGMGGFINSWLSKQQDSAPRETFSGGRHGGNQKPAHESFAADLMRSIHQDHGRQSSVPEGGGEIIDITPSGSETRDRDQAA